MLAVRDASLGDLELWAVCHETCVALRAVHTSCDIFQCLCITPDTLAFDGIGTVCLLELSTGQYSQKRIMLMSFWYRRYKYLVSSPYHAYATYQMV